MSNLISTTQLENQNFGSNISEKCKLNAEMNLQGILPETAKISISLLTKDRDLTIMFQDNNHQRSQLKLL